MSHVSGRTALIIAPPYRFKTLSYLMTNFHQPQSTLLLLVAAAIGPQWASFYQEAMQHGYRFLSYGDSQFLEVNRR
ncbi:MAG: S-adenosylmethionine:tRNA ribosyltransferase-isomerase [Bacteroidetes bacterium]|nr:S-adenosylmethionine:tRNA ribosyltransferase-isomerase [Bacteroidota bacterium]